MHEHIKGARPLDEGWREVHCSNFSCRAPQHPSTCELEYCVFVFMSDNHPILLKNCQNGK